MRTWSLRIGRLFGVDLRLHFFFALLLLLLFSYAGISGVSSGRGIALWFILLFSIAIREIARAIVSAALGLELRSLLFLPIGAIPTYASAESAERATQPRAERILALIGPLANLFAALAFASLISAIAPQIDLRSRPWLAPGHLLRALVWMQLVFAGMHLLPAFPLDLGRILRSEFDRSQGNLKGARAAAGLGQLVATVMVLVGFFRPDVWLVAFGTSILLAATMEGAAALHLRPDVEAVTMRDVMLTGFTTLSASDTLEDALAQSIHSLQDVFPVTRGPQIVGSVGRQVIVDALQSSGNAYLQGIMTRTLPTAQPTDSLIRTLRRIATGRGAQLVPIVEEGRVVGIVTPQNLAQSMSLLDHQRNHQRRTAAESE